MANSGELDPRRLASAARRINDHLRVLTGLPRADRWVEVRGPAYDDLLEQATALEPLVVVDTGFCIEHDPDAYSTATSRHAMTMSTLARADHVVVVGSADPVGLTRLVRSIHDLQELHPDVVPTVVINRMRSTLGWTERDLTSTLGDVHKGLEIFFLPDDRASADRALMAGRSLVESGDSPLRRALAEVANSLVSARLAATC